MPTHPTKTDNSLPRRRAFVYNGGFVFQKHLREIMALAGYDIKIGRPRADDCVAVWGTSPTAWRGEAMAHKSNVPLVRVEDAFLRSLFPARVKNEPPLGLMIDTSGLHFDAARISDLERILLEDPLDNGALLTRAKYAIERIKKAHLTKYAACDLEAPLPDPGYVLVVDQVRNDASVRASKGNDALFSEMLYWAQDEHPAARIVIKTHPETRHGVRQGYYGPEHCTDKISLYDGAASPYQLLENAVAVYTVSSQMGFEAILAGHKPRVFGQPFYAGWGLTEDAFPVDRRHRKLTRNQLFVAAMMKYTQWRNPHTGGPAEIDDILGYLEAQTRAWRDDHAGWSASNIRLWKRGHFRKFFGQHGPLSFSKDPSPQAQNGRRQMIWGSAPAPTGTVRIEDGFIRSRGLGAELIPPMSLVLDDLGLYYDPTRHSRLEQLILAHKHLTPAQEHRVERLREALIDHGISKYNLEGSQSPLPEGHKVLVVGQVEDDASIQLGAQGIKTNLDLLKQARLEFPNSQILYKPHPDVEAGLRSGAIQADDYADMCVPHDAMDRLLGRIDHLVTMTSLSGFEALLRGVPVTTYGAPFYAGWGLTHEKGPVPARRERGVSLQSLLYATLIAYPRYFDPISNLPCSAETVVMRLADGMPIKSGPFIRSLAKLQGLLASPTPFWR